MTDSRSTTKSHKSTAKRAGKFAIIGVILTLCNFATYTLLARLVFRDNSLLWLVSAISYIATTFIAYLLHSKITWRERRPTKIGIINFFIWNLITACAISPAFTWLFGLFKPFYQNLFSFSEALHLPFDFAFIESTGVFCLTTAITMVLNYIFYDKLVFGGIRYSDLFRSAKSTTEKLKAKLSQKLHAYRPLLRPLLILFAIYLFAITTIILAGVHYIDDQARTFEGYRGWSNFSRYTSNILSTVVHTSSYLANIAPLTQILACFIMALASVILIKSFIGDKKITFWHIIAVAPLAISPYYLECFSYQFDAPYMALSVFFSVLPLLFIDYRKKSFLTITAISTIFVCTTYQASLGIFPIAIIMLSFLKWLKKSNPTKLIIASVLGYVFGILIFKLFLMKEVDDYVSTGSFALSELIPGTFTNLGTFYGIIFSDFSIIWTVFIGILVVSFLILSVINSRRHRFATTGVSFFTLALSACLCFGVYIILKNPLFAGRSTYGFGALLAVLTLACTTFSHNSITKLSSLALCYCFIVFSFAYGNALAEQYRYLDFRMTAALNDLDTYLIDPETKDLELRITGGAGNSPILENMPQWRGVLHRLTHRSTSFADDWWWGTYYFNHYYGLYPNHYFDHNHQVDIPKESLELLYDGYYHSISKTDQYLVLHLKDN